MTTYPLTLLWPGDTRAALPHGRWRRLPDGRIEATYNSQDELDLCLEPTRVNGSAPRTERGRKALVEHWHRSLAIPADREQMELPKGED